MNAVNFQPRTETPRTPLLTEGQLLHRFDTRLTRRERNILLLCAMDDWNFARIARETGLSHAEIYRHRVVARVKLTDIPMPRTRFGFWVCRLQIALADCLARAHRKAFKNERPRLHHLTVKH